MLLMASLQPYGFGDVSVITLSWFAEEVSSSGSIIEKSPDRRAYESKDNYWHELAAAPTQQRKVGNRTLERRRGIRQ